MPHVLRSLLTLFGLAFAMVAPGCAAGGAASRVEWRVMVKLAQPATDASAIVSLATNAGGVPVRYAAGVSPQWHALVLSCPDEAACVAAMRRMEQDSAHFLAVQRDERRRPNAAAASSSNP